MINKDNASNTNDLLTVAKQSKTPVTVWMNGEFLGYEGIVEKFDKHKVKINGMYFPRSTCEFKIR